MVWLGLMSGLGLRLGYGLKGLGYVKEHGLELGLVRVRVG